MDNIGRFASKKPQIKVYYNENIKNIEYIKEILLGIEEEGIPGIGIDNNYIVLHYNKLKEESPIFKIKFISEDKQKRSLGANAARLVTRMPFKEIENLG